MSKTLVEYVRLPDVTDASGAAHFCFGLAEDPSSTFWFDKKKSRKMVTGMHVGQVYAIPTTILQGEDDERGGRRTLSFGEREWKGQHPDAEKALTWQAQQRSFDLREEAKRREAREGTGTSAMEDALDPVARAYAALPYPQRAAFEVWVLSYLRRKGAL